MSAQLYATIRQNRTEQNRTEQDREEQKRTVHVPEELNIDRQKLEEHEG